ncbi:MAG TPA: hypothetical protein VK427_11770 [Kofleriaceae bacterium]|nr:hypothetical protein [Kofleriaceae bacterium]
MLAAALCCACSDGEDEDDRPSVIGRWKTPCNPDDEGAGRHVELFEFRADQSFEAAVIGYPAGVCNEADRTDRLRFIGTYQAESKKAGETGTLDFTLQGGFITLYSPATVAVYNQVAYCGSTNWTQGIEQSLLGRGCAGIPFESADRRYEIYKIEEGRLYLGADSEFQSPSEAPMRATMFDTIDVFDRAD